MSSMRSALSLPPDRTSAGLATYLAGKAESIPITHLPSHLGFDIIFAGEPSMSSTELLSSPRFHELAKSVRDYDLVLFDSPPCTSLADPGVIARHVDGVVFCARWGQAQPDRVASCLDQLKAVGGKIVGLVVTFMPDRDQPFYGADRIYNKRLIGRQV
jgi:succinoglycan biosynthesis transport protein ExoP